MEALKILSPIHRATRQMDLYLAGFMQQYGVSNTEGHLLTYLLSYAPCPISELHRVFGLKNSTLTSVLDRLEERGFLLRKPHPRDRRSLVVFLSPKGRSLARKLRGMLETFEKRVLAELKPGHLKGFHLVMEAINKISGMKVRASAVGKKVSSRKGSS